MDRERKEKDVESVAVVEQSTSMMSIEQVRSLSSTMVVVEREI